MATSRISAAASEIFRDAAQPLEARVADLLSRLTLEEMVSLMAGSAAFTLMGIERLGIPAVRVADGPTGVRSNEGEAATVFPVGVAMASTWNPDLTREVAGAIAREALALNDHVVLAPTINIVRTPLWGRNFETYSEDPFLAGMLGAAYIEGLQAEGVGASLKHYAVNNQEEGRMTVSAEVDERTLREIYLAGFELAVKRARPWTVMASYNKINGTYATENAYLLTDILKGEWKWDGVVVSDWGAVHSTAPAANAGCDLEMPGPALCYGEKLLNAVRADEVPRWRIEESARRMLRLILRTGVLDGAPVRKGELRSQRHREIAGRAAEEGVVLLKNQADLLPLDLGAIRTLAVVGPNAAARRIQGGGSSQVRAGRQTSILQAIRELVGGQCEVLHGDGGDNEPVPPTARPALFSPDEARSQAGLTCEYFAQRGFDAAPYRASPERQIGKLVSTASMSSLGQGLGALRWTGWFWPERDGRHEFSIRAPAPARLLLEGEVVIDESTPGSVDAMDVGGTLATRRIAAAELVGGRGYPVQIEYVRPEDTSALRWEFVGVGLRQPAGSMEEAAALAAGADAAVVVIGAASATEAEGYDRPSLDLPGDQNALVEAVLAANPHHRGDDQWRALRHAVDRSCSRHARGLARGRGGPRGRRPYPIWSCRALRAASRQLSPPPRGLTRPTLAPRRGAGALRRGPFCRLPALRPRRRRADVSLRLRTFLHALHLFRHRGAGRGAHRRARRGAFRLEKCRPETRQGDRPALRASPRSVAGTAGEGTQGLRQGGPGSWRGAEGFHDPR